MGSKRCRWCGRRIRMHERLGVYVHSEGPAQFRDYGVRCSVDPETGKLDRNGVTRAAAPKPGTGADEP